MAWPPKVDELKADLGIDDTRDDEQLSTVLAAAVAHVSGTALAGAYNFAGDLFSDLPDPTDSVILGTLRLAGRWHTRRRSPDGLVSMGELGSSNVPSLDVDIERLLGVGRYREPMVG